ncbi:hypothetical protein MP228_009017 [Amoeboaphelidium protococcarum]|nr:hypothetical protein MP228_009017 [Amoeboaphelidium protococcarum]
MKICYLSRYLLSCAVLPLLSCASDVVQGLSDLNADALQNILNNLEVSTLRNTRLSSRLLRKVSDVRAGVLVNDSPNLQRYGFYSLEYAIASEYSPFIVSLVGKTYENNLLNYKLMLAVDRAFGVGQIQTRPGLPDINSKDINALIIRTIIHLPGADYKVLRFPLKRQYMLCKSDIVEWILSLDNRLVEEFGEDYADIQSRCSNDRSDTSSPANILNELNRKFKKSIRLLNISDMEQYILQGASIDFEQGFALYSASCLKSNVQMVRVLLNYGANVNICLPAWVAQQCDLETFQLHIKYGLDLNKYGDDLLVKSSRYVFQIPVVRYLFESHRDSLSKQGMERALASAAVKSNSLTVELLKSFGVHEGIECQNALIQQAHQGQELVVAGLLIQLRFPLATVWNAIQVTEDNDMRQMLTQYLNDHFSVRSDVDILAE